MSQDLPLFNNDEQLKAENDFLKMKLMLERGAEFHESEDNEIPPEIENAFLNNVIAFEKQFEKRKRIKVYDKIGMPKHFKPVNEIQDHDIDKEWNLLSDYLNDHDIGLGVCSPNISTRELYRFTTEELFEYEMDDMNLPGWITNFIYDEFHPDPVYDNSRSAITNCIARILEKSPMEWTGCFAETGLRLNEHYPLTCDQFKNIINNFKSAYVNMYVRKIDADKCALTDQHCLVNGHYTIDTLTTTKKQAISGTWEVVFEKEMSSGYWHIKDVQISGVDFCSSTIENDRQK